MVEISPHLVLISKVTPCEKQKRKIYLCSGKAGYKESIDTVIIVCHDDSMKKDIHFQLFTNKSYQLCSTRPVLYL